MKSSVLPKRLDQKQTDSSIFSEGQRNELGSTYFRGKIKNVTFAFFLAVSAAGCSSDDNSGSTTPDPVDPVNIAPTANAGDDQTVDEQTSVTLNASGSADSDGSIATFLWSQTAGTSVTLSDDSISMPEFTAPTLLTAETLTFQVTVTDDENSSASDLVNVTINPVNANPEANAGAELTVDEQTTVTLDGSGSSDSDGSISSYEWLQTAGASVVLSATNEVSPTFEAPNVDAVETLTFELTVQDNEGGSDTASVNIFVNPVEENAVPASQLEASLFLNELYFEYGDRIGQKVWTLGFYGNTEVGQDGHAYLVDNMLRLEVDEQLPHHSFARLDGVLPPDDWQGNQILIYGVIKDFATETGLVANQPTPLITVEKYELVSVSEQNNSWQDTFLPPDVAPENVQPSEAKHDSYTHSAKLTFSPLPEPALKPRPGTKAQDCDRSVIISGGIDDSNNYGRYINNVVAKFNKMKELGFSDDQIEVFYNDGAAINVEGTNIVDEKTSNEKLKEHFEQLAEDMPGSCTLTVFVTDHGTGFNFEQGYEGARPALSGSEATSGKLFDENTFIFDAREKTYQTTASFVYRGSSWFFTKDGEGNVRIYKRVGREWVFKGTNTNGDNIISETELGGEDINGDGDTTDADYGLSIEVLESRLVERKYNSNEWDTDGDGTIDVRLRWDGSRFVVERLDEGEWKEMGRDTNGDYFIDIIDGGVDWNLDGDKADQIGFHEGINLWGDEVLWDDEFADLLKPLSDKGVHIMMEMVSCFSGGFVPNVKDLVENIYAGSDEDTKHYNRLGDDGKYFAADEIAFLDNLSGIDTDSWNAAADAATAVDDALATAQNATKNVHIHEQTTRFESGSKFQLEGNEFEYGIELDLPDDLVGEIYDFEFILGLQKPRWESFSVVGELPEGLEIEEAPGGFRIFSSEPIPDGVKLKIKVEGLELESDDQVRIEYTDIDHKRLGYTMAGEGEIEFPGPEISFSEPKTCVNHTDHGTSSPSIIEWLLLASILDQYQFADIQLTIRVTTPTGSEDVLVTLRDSGQVYILFNIFLFGQYQLEIIDAQHVPSGEVLQLIGDLLFPINVTATETNKGQCTPD